MKRIGVKVIGGLIAVIVLLQANINMVWAVTQADIDKKSKESENTSAEIKENEKELKEVQAQKSETVKQVEELSTQISNYESQIEELDGQITQLNNRIEESEQKLKEAEEEYTEQENLLEERLVATYEAGETSYLDFILSSKSITDLISNYYLVTEVATSDTELLEKIQKQKEEIEESKKQLEADKQELATSKASKQSMTTQLQTAKTQKNQQVEKLSEDEKEIQAHIEELRVASAQIEKDLKVAQQQYQKQIEELNKKNQENSSGGSNNSGSSGGNNTGGGSGRLSPPVTSGRITATMYYSNGSYHGALDYGIPVGTPIYSAADGVVLKTANLTTSYGTHVVIQHAGGLQSWYAHGTSGSICVSPGQTVSKGQLIMKSGNSGNSSGPHLHFEVRVSPYNYSNCRVDPRNYF